MFLSLGFKIVKPFLLKKIDTIVFNEWQIYKKFLGALNNLKR